MLIAPTWIIRPAFAFQCLNYFPVEQRLTEFDGVFVGEIAGIQQVLKRDGSEDYVVKFKLERYWKGFSETDEYALVRVVYAPGESYPSIEETIGEKMLIYADSAEDYEIPVFWTLPICDGSTELPWAVDDFSFLGPGSLAAGRTDVPPRYIKEFELDYDHGGIWMNVTGVTVNVLPSDLEIEPGKSVMVLVPMGTYGDIRLTFPRNMIEGIHSINSSDGQVIHFDELSADGSSTTIQAYVPADTDYLEIYGARVIPEFPIQLIILPITFAFLIGMASLRILCAQRSS